jgi:dihydroorotase
VHSSPRRRFLATCAALALPVPLRARAASADYDLVIRGGLVFDPARGMQARADVGIRGGRITAIDDLAAATALRTVDATGRWVVPGLIDLQVRGYPRNGRLASGFDDPARSGGVTAWASAGDLDATDVAAMRRDDRLRTRSRAYAFVAFDRRTAQRDAAARNALARSLAEQHDVALGLMLRFDGRDESPRALLDVAVDLLRAAGTRLRILCPLPVAAGLDDLLDGLRPGDIVAGVYGSNAGALREGSLRPALKAARARGVIVDVGHGLTQFDASVARQAIEQGLLPDVISSASDMRPQLRLRPTRLVDVMNAFLEIGLAADEVLAMTTIHPARVIGRDAHLGTLALDAVADIALLGVEPGPAGTRIHTVTTLRRGALLA